MKNIISKVTAPLLVQVFLFILINAFYVIKYVSRVESINMISVLIVYIVSMLFYIGLYHYFSNRWSVKLFKIGFWIILISAVIAIIAALVYIDPYSVKVDRWSAVVFWLDGLFNGEYPYGIHTHVSETNYSSPFPFWYVLSLPFYLLGDVGIGLIFFLVVTALTVKCFFDSYKKAFLFLSLLLLSPAYWWEVLVRSDSLSNAFLVFIIILYITKKEFQLQNKVVFTAIICGLIACTRLSAILPLTLFFFKPFMQINWKSKLLFLSIIIGICFLIFSPFVFWDTQNWIFFSRNPFMSQGDPNNPYILAVFIVIGIIFSYSWKNMNQYFSITSCFLFLFLIPFEVTPFFDGETSLAVENLYDMSYFTLIFPYCLAFISDTWVIEQEDKHI